MKRYVMVGVVIGTLIPIVIALVAYFFSYQFGRKTILDGATVAVWQTSLLLAVADDVRPRPSMSMIFAQSMLLNIAWYMFLACAVYWMRFLIKKFASYN